MKKSFLTICGLLMVFFTACARLQYQNAGGWVSGLVMAPESAVGTIAEAQVLEAEAYATRKCADQPERSGWGYGGLDTPARNTWAGVQAVRNYQSGAGGNSSGQLEKKVDTAIAETRKLRGHFKNFLRLRAGKYAK